MAAEDFTSHYDFRSEMVERLVTDLVGPEDPASTEVITDPPITRYAAGVLFPQSAEDVTEETLVDDETEAAESDPDTTIDPAVSMANVRYPSSIGMTFAVDGNVTGRITITVQAARYVSDAESTRPGRHAIQDDADKWRRVPQLIDPQTVDVLRIGDSRRDLCDGLQLFLRVRRPDEHRRISVTVSLLNSFHVGSGERDPYAFFQPKLIATGPDGTRPFVERPTSATDTDDYELRSHRLLYRHAPTYAVGHGCAVEWTAERKGVNAAESAAGASEIRTALVPRYELWMADSNPEIDTSRLGMSYLARASNAEVHDALMALAEGYRSWIADRRVDTQLLPVTDLVELGEDNLRLCDEACERIEAGIFALSDPEVMAAFRLANSAMAMQRARADWLKERDPSAVGPDESAGTWRPFQIAFVLLSIPEIVESRPRNREIADVLWFPTGGGKTEAYLGLIAFTVFLRRRRNPGRGGGMTVLMRYTLRLLTLQQFERAALLICCMEHLRRNDSERLGATEISIGMWVGEGSTPNWLRDAKTALRNLAQDKPIQKKNPVQLRTCPWCGRALDWRNYSIIGASLVIACGDEDCAFGDGLPVHVIDETIYDARPTLIIATVDKFASIPWQPQVARLFNRGTDEPPPELIIQDELHLISGPLGTLAGLYETAIDMAAHRPKIIASTATIRRAGEQGRNLFDREIRQFPPPGIDARDSYFSVERHPSHRPSRLYVGVMAPATSQTSLMLRTYAALLHAAMNIDGTDEVRDTYWTLVGYFNSLRLLAGARLQVHDDVVDRLDYLARLLGEPKRELPYVIELTSREPSSEIPKHLKEMDRALPDEPVDVILATNLISVGVDINRLGLMAVMGQPQSTSEYIQATSRVGRRWPGIAVAMYNANRSRDRSHYEDFVAYHSALYRQVEATSVTPFSARARDRGLHAVVIGLARLLIPEARPREAAAAIADFEPRLREICGEVLCRVNRTMDATKGKVATSESRATEDQIDQIIRAWVARAEDCPDMVYDDRRHPEKALLIEAGRYDGSDEEISETLPTQRSLRDVDVESKLYLDWGTR